MVSRPRWLLSLTQRSEKPPYLLKYRSAEWFIIGTVALAVFTDMFLYGLIVPVVPFALQTRVHVEAAKVQSWVSILVAVYGAALLAFSPVCGWLADRTSSRRSSLLLGLLALLGATVLLNVGSSYGLWVVGRILQGASAAVVWVVGLALIADTVQQEQLAQAMGYVTLGMSVGILIAPLLGGIVFEHGGYNAVFGMAYALIGLDICLRLLLVEKKVAVRWTKDMLHEEGNTVQYQSKEVSMSHPEKTPIPSPQPDGAAVPVPPPRRLRHRLPPLLSLLYSRRLLAVLFGALIQAALVTAFDSVLVLHAVQIFHWKSTASSLLFLPLVLPTFFAPAIGWLMGKVPSRWLASLGFFLACPPLVLLRYVDHDTMGQKVLLCALLALIGTALTLTFPPIMVEISAITEAKERNAIEEGSKPSKGGAYAQAYGLFNVAFAGGCLAGPLLAGFIRESRGWATMAWVLGLLSAVTGFPILLWLGGWIGSKTTGQEERKDEEAQEDVKK